MEVDGSDSCMQFNSTASFAQINHLLPDYLTTKRDYHSLKAIVGARARLAPEDDLYQALPVGWKFVVSCTMALVITPFAFLSFFHSKHSSHTYINDFSLICCLIVLFHVGTFGNWDL